ncbi:MAG: ZIP family metal transporter [Candidatus Gracilibacteria bacterium]|nr:ZIP family metal transporter [Candidatus Gracilibacteria bacterium]
MGKIEQGFLQKIISLGAGSMIAISIVHILPESIETNPNNVFYFIIGFIIIYFVENFLMIHSCVEHDCHYHHVSIVSWIALFIHTLFDGIGIGAGYLNSSYLGFVILSGVAIHQIPVSISISGLLRHSKFTKKIQTILMVIFAISAPVGFGLSYFFLSGMNSEKMISIFLAISGGSLLYIGASDLLPTVHNNSKNRGLIILFFLIGIIGVSLVKLFE